MLDSKITSLVPVYRVTSFFFFPILIFGGEKGLCNMDTAMFIHT